MVASTSDTVATFSCYKIEQLVVDFEGHQVLTLAVFELELEARIEVVIASAYAGNASEKGWNNIVWFKFALVFKYRLKHAMHILVCVLKLRSHKRPKIILREVNFGHAKKLGLFIVLAP